MTELSQIDVFLSYGEADEKFVAAVARRLQGARLNPWFRPWHARRGEDIQDQMDQALGRSRTCAVFIGAGGLSGWQDQQMRAAIQARVEDEPGYRVIPVLLPGADRPKRRDLPRFLRLLEPVEFHSADDERAFRYLLSGILGIRPIDVEDFLSPEVQEEEQESVAFDRLHIDPDEPPIRVIRQLLLAAFEPETLRRFCQEHGDFRELLNRFGAKYSLDDMVDEVITYSGTYLLWDDLLEGVARVNHRAYEHWESELRQATGVTVAEQGAIPRPRSARSPGPAPGGARDASPWAAAAMPAEPATGPIRHRWALLVGINHYVEPSFPTLKYCVNDVLALDRVLTGRGYTTVVMHDDLPGGHRLFPTRNNVKAELASLCRAAQPDDLLWAHFACHGKLVEGQPLLVTNDTRASLLAEQALPLADVEERMRKSSARRLVITLDACHTGVEVGRDISDPEFIKNAYDLAEGFALIAASTAQQVAQEWDEKQHGVFTYYLLEGLSGRADRNNRRFVTVGDLATHVLDGLRQWNVKHGGLVQEPTYRMAAIGDMILADYRKTEDE